MRELLTALRDALADEASEQELIERLSDAAVSLGRTPEDVLTLAVVERALEDLA